MFSFSSHPRLYTTPAPTSSRSCPWHKGTPQRLTTSPSTIPFHASHTTPCHRVITQTSPTSMLVGASTSTELALGRSPANRPWGTKVFMLRLGIALSSQYLSQVRIDYSLLLFTLFCPFHRLCLWRRHACMHCTAPRSSFLAPMLHLGAQKIDAHSIRPNPNHSLSTFGSCAALPKRTFAPSAPISDMLLWRIGIFRNTRTIE